MTVATHKRHTKMLHAFRLHTGKCSKGYARQDRSGIDCGCAIHVEGKLGTSFIRKTAKTRSMDEAQLRINRAEVSGYWDAPVVPLLDAVATGMSKSCTFFQGSKRGRTGKISEALVMADLMRMGYEVFQPVNPILPYDFLVADGEKFLRVEVKTVPSGGRKVRVDMPPKQELLDVIAMVNSDGKVCYHVLTPEDKKSKLLCIRAA